MTTAFCLPLDQKRTYAPQFASYFFFFFFFSLFRKRTDMLEAHHTTSTMTIRYPTLLPQGPYL